MKQVYKVNRVSGTVVELDGGLSVSTNDDFFQEGQLVFLLRRNSVLSDKLRGTLRLRHDSYSKMPSGLYRLVKDVAARASLLIPTHIKDKATGQFHTPSEESNFDFLSLLGVESPEVALSKYTFDVGEAQDEAAATTEDDLYPDKVNPERSFVSDEELLGGVVAPPGSTDVGETALGMTPVLVIDTASNYYDSGITSPSAWSEENEEAGGK